MGGVGSSAPPARRPSTRDPRVRVPIEPPPATDLRPAAGFGRYHPHSPLQLTRFRPLWPFGGSFTTTAVTVAELTARVVPVLAEAGFTVQSHRVEYYRPSPDPEDWVPDEFVWGEKEVGADRGLTRPSDSTVYALFAVGLGVTAVGVWGIVVRFDALVSFLAFTLGLLAVLYTWMFTGQTYFWSDVVLVSFERSPATPGAGKAAQAPITGRVNVTAGRMLSQNVVVRGGMIRRIREFYESPTLSGVRDRLEELFAAEALRGA